jgi:hypothetical protein
LHRLFLPLNEPFDKPALHKQDDKHRRRHNEKRDPAMATFHTGTSSAWGIRQKADGVEMLSGGRKPSFLRRGKIRTR